MKRILLALTMVGLLVSGVPKASADTEVSLDLFYDNLSPHGSWIEVADYGYAFQPSVAVSNPDWRPYSDGYWAYTDLGWTWVSYEDFGWATYHYGRWANLDSFGWVWVPGYEWGPAWVSWRTGGDYVGWAPLPPQRGEVVYAGTAITNQVDIQFGIGPLYYNFVDIRYIGEPVLRGRILPPTRNVTIINNTVNVTNITYNNSVVYNYGPDYNRLNQYSTRPVQRLTIQRETTVGANLAQGRKGNFNRVSGNQLTVVAPTIQKSQQKVAPKQVKTKVEKPTVETGWKGINNRQQVEAEMKKGDPKNIKAPDFQPQKDRKREAVAGADQSPAGQPQETAPAAGQPAQDAQQAQQQQQRDERQQQREQKRQEREQAQPGQADQAGQQPDAAKDREEKRKNRRGETRESATPEATQPEAASQPERAGQNDAQKPDRQKRAEERRAQRAEQTGQEEAKPDRETRADRQRKAPKAEQADENQSAPESSRPETTSRPRRGQRAEGAQSAPSGDDNAGAGSQAEPRADRPERAQRQTQERRSQQEQARPQQQEQARPQQREQARPRQQEARPQRQRQEPQPGSGEATGERKGKKKKPVEEPSPQP